MDLSRICLETALVDTTPRWIAARRESTTLRELSAEARVSLGCIFSWSTRGTADERERDSIFYPFPLPIWDAWAASTGSRPNALAPEGTTESLRDLLLRWKRGPISLFTLGLPTIPGEVRTLSGRKIWGRPTHLQQRVNKPVPYPETWRALDRLVTDPKGLYVIDCLEATYQLGKTRPMSMDIVEAIVAADLHAVLR